MRTTLLVLAIVALTACSDGMEDIAATCEAAETFLTDVQDMFSGPPPASQEEAIANRERVRDLLTELVDAAERTGDDAFLAPATQAREAADSAFEAASPQRSTDLFQKMFDSVERLTATCVEEGVEIDAPASPAGASSETGG